MDFKEIYINVMGAINLKSPAGSHSRSSYSPVYAKLSLPEHVERDITKSSRCLISHDFFG
jgi:hypothetical protein